jgi:trans-aconitate methyltransferase
MTDTQSAITWDSALYDEKHAFVFKYGEDLLKLLNPQKNELVIDLGCGTGHLTHKIAEAGALVTGIDNSAEMIEKARHEYPSLHFERQNGINFKLDELVDAVFSNATLHWIPEKEKVIAAVYYALKKGGRFVAEFGGKGNVDNILKAIKNVLMQEGFTENALIDIWYYPSIAEYAMLLEKQGFRVVYATHVDRLTEFNNPETGMYDWINMFCGDFFKDIENAEKEELISKIIEDLRATNYKNSKWYGDYKRIRIVAIKE